MFIKLAGDAELGEELFFWMTVFIFKTISTCYQGKF